MTTTMIMTMATPPVPARVSFDAPRNEAASAVVSQLQNELARLRAALGADDENRRSSRPKALRPTTARQTAAATTVRRRRPRARRTAPTTATKSATTHGANDSDQERDARRQRQRPRARRTAPTTTADSDDGDRQAAAQPSAAPESVFGRLEPDLAELVERERAALRSALLPSARDDGAVAVSDRSLVQLLMTLVRRVHHDLSALFDALPQSGGIDGLFRKDAAKAPPTEERRDMWRGGRRSITSMFPGLKWLSNSDGQRQMSALGRGASAYRAALSATRQGELFATAQHDGVTFFSCNAMLQLDDGLVPASDSGMISKSAIKMRCKVRASLALRARNRSTLTCARRNAPPRR